MRTNVFTRKPVDFKIVKRQRTISFFVSLFFLFTLTAVKVKAQTPGFIYQPATTVAGKAVLDKNGNGYTSTSTAGFPAAGTAPNFNDFGSNSALNMTAIVEATSEPVGDVSTGATGGQTDIVGGSQSVYVVNDGTNLIIRFRIGKNSSASKGYCLLIDTNKKIGTADPNYATRPSSLGFEFAATLETNFGVVVRNLITNTVVNTYATGTHEQRSIANSTIAGNTNVFYDFYIPLSDITTNPATASLRFAATSINSGNSDFPSGTASDINGINDQTYSGNLLAAFTTAVNSFPPTTLSTMTSGFSFASVLSNAPTITSALTTASSAISGKSTEAAGTTITIYRNIGGTGSYTSIGTTTTRADSTWTWSTSGLSPALAANDLIEATATASLKGESIASNIVTVAGTQICYTVAPVITSGANGSQQVGGTWSDGVTTGTNTVRIRFWQQTAGTNTFTEVGPAGSTGASPATPNYVTFTGTSGTFNVSGITASQTSFKAGAIYATATIVSSGCQSGYSNSNIVVTSGSSGADTPAPTITTTPIQASSSATNVVIQSGFTSSYIILYVNGIQVAANTTTATASGSTTTLSYTGFNVGDIVTAREYGSTGSNWLSVPSNSITVTAATLTSTAPVITGSYVSGTGKTVSGTSVEQSGSSVILYDNGTQIGTTTTVNSFGNWSVTGLSLTSGHVLTAKVTALGKLISAASAPVTVGDATSVPTAPTVTSPILAGTTSISGTGGVGTVTVYEDGAILGTTTGSSWTLSGLATTDVYKGGSIYATNTSGGLTSANSATVTVSGIDHFLVEAAGGGNIGTQTAGTPFNIQITAETNAVNGTTFSTYNATNYVFSGSFVSSGTGPTTAFSSGFLNTWPVTLTTAGTYSITSTTTDLSVTGTSNTFTINAGPANKLIVKTQPSTTATNGTYFTQQPAIYVEDQYGNIRTSDNTTQVTVAIASGTGTLNGVTTVTAVNGVATFSGLSITGTGSYTLGFSSSGLTGATSGTIVVSAGTPPAPTGLSYTTPNVYTTGSAITPLSPTVTGTVISYGISPALPTGLSINTTTGVISGTPTVGAAVQSYTVTATNSGGSTTFGVSITVNSLAATKLAITTQPSSTATSGTAFAQQPVIQLQDGSSNPVSQSGVVVTAAIASGNGVLGGTLTATTNASGVATFTDLKITGTTGIRTITFTSTGLTAATSGNVTIGAGAATQLAITTQPSSTATSGSNFGQQPVIQLQDASGNAVSQSGVVVTAAVNTGSGTLGGTLTATTDASGTATFTNLKITGTTGIRTLTFTATSLTAANSGNITISAGAATQLAITTQPSSTATSGTAFGQQPVIQLQDASGNAVSQSGVVVTAAVNTGSGTLGGTLTATTDASGVATFTNLKITGTTGIRTLAFTATSLTAANSGNITISAGAATQLAITTQPSSTATSGTAFGQQPVIQLQDASGNAVSQSGVVVTAAVNTGSGTLGGTLTATTDASGVATFTNLKITGTTGIRTLTFTATSLTAANSGNITIGAGAATQLAITTQPSSTATSGTAFGQQPVIQLQDASGNAVSQSGVVVTAAVNTGSGTLGGTLTATTDASGVATFTNLKITGTTGIRTLTFTATSLTAANSGNITISAGAATQLAITTQPSSTATSGTAFGQQPVIQLQDASGNAVSQSGVVVTAAVNTGSGTLGGTLTATTDASGVATFTNLKITGTTGIRTLTFTATSLTAANSGNITISAGAATQLAITTQPSSTATSGTAFGQQPVIQLQDASGNAVSQSGVVVTAAVNTGSGTLGGTLTATTDASGTATFTNLKITGTTGIRTLTFTATSLTAANSGNITIGAGAATQLAITTQPSSTATSGTAFGQQPVIQLQDASGNAVSQSGVVVTAAVNTGSGTLGGTLTATTDASGVATFTNLKITGTTGIRTLTFTATSLTAANSGNITISAGAATQLAITTQPSSTATSGTAFGQQPVIQLQDASGNAVSQSGVVVTAAVNTGSGTLGGTLTATTDASGVATFTNLKITGTTGIRTLTFTATSLTAANSGNITISAGAATQLAITTQPSSTATSGTAFGQQPVIQLQDASGNAVSQSGVVVTAAVNTGSGTLGGTLTATTNASGVATFTDLVITGTTGIRTLTFTATSLTAANSGNITIGAGAATQLAITTQPSSTATSGTAFGQQPVIQLQDASGNAVSQSGVVVTAAVNTGSGTLGGTLTATTDASGTATFTNLKITGTTGIRTLTFTATSLTAANSGNVTISAGAATQLAITTQPSSTATSGTAFGQQPVIQLQDASGNAVSQSGVVVTAAVNTGSGVLGGTLTATTDASGVATFTNLKITGTTGIRTLTFTATSLTAANSGNVTISAGAATQLAITTQPSSTATSGTAFGQQPVIQLQDASGNAVSQSGVVVTAAVNTGSGTLGGTLTATTNASGVATFTDLVITGTTGIRTLTFTATSLTAANSGNITISAGAATQLAITTQPSSTATSGSNFGQQPVIQLQDASGNAVSQSGVVVTAAVNTGSGVLGGTLTATTDASGVATFTNLKITGTTGIRTLTFTATSLTAANSGNVTISAGAATQLAITTQPSSTATSGTAFGQQPVIQLQDASGNAVSQSGVVVTAAVNTGSGVLGGTLTATTDASGTATFTNLKITGTTGIRTLTFTATSLTAANSGNVTISAGAATQLAITTQPSSTATSGTAFGQQPVIQLQDASGNAVSQSGVVVTAAVNTGSGVLGGTLTATTDASGTATFTNLKITGTTGIRTLTFTATSLTAANSGNITISAGAATQLAITTQPSSTATSGTAFGQQPVIQLQDASGNAVSQSGVVVTAAVNTGSGTLGGTLTATTDASGVATFTNLKITGTTGIRTLTFTATSLTAANSGNVTISAGAATQLAITTQPSSTATSGTAFGQQPVIQLQDASGNAVSQSGVVVTAAVNIGSGVLGGTLTATTDASGTATFTNLKITGTTGIRTLTFTATSLTAANSGNVTISAGAAAQLAITTQPSSTATSGTAFGQQPVIQLQDASGNAVSQSGVVVTAAVNTGSGTLGGTLTATTDASGVATFTNLKITGTTGIRTLTFTATSLTAANSGNITISAGAATQLAITTQPSSTATSGTAFGQQPVIQLQDASGNAVSQSGVVVTAAVNTGSGTLGGTLTATTNASGVATFTDLVITGTTGIRTLTFTATSLTAANSGNITIGAGAATQLAITTQPSSTATSGTAFGQQPVIQLQDASGNAVSQSGVVVTAAVNTGSGVLGGTLTATTDASGTATFTNLKITGTTGIRTLTFTATSLTAANSGNITIGAGAATQLAITTQPSSTATSGTAFGQQPVIQLQDASGNAVSQSGVVVTAAVNTGSGVLGGTLTATTDASGTATFTNLKITGTTGIRTLTFTATSLTAANSGNITISAGAATQLAITTQPSSTATSGTAFGQQPVIQLQDASGNAVSQSGVVVTAAVNTGSGTLGGTLTATTDASGVATFTNLKITGTTGIRTLTFTATSLTAANSGNVTISAGAATQLAITTQPSSTATSGTAFGQQPVIQLQDASGNAVSQSGVVVTAAVNTGSGVLGGTLTATTDASGTATFTNLKITGTTGIRTLTFTATSLTAANSGNVTISAGAATQLAITTQPSSTATSGTAFGQQPVIQLQDASGNAVSQSGVVVTAAVNTGSGTLGGTLTATTDASGVATFTNLKITGTTGIRTLTFTATSLTAANSGNITISAGAATQLAITTQPSSTATSGTAFGQQPVIQLQDASGNAVSQSGVVVTAAVNTGSGTLGGTLTATTNASGVATFTDLVITGTTGIRTLTFTATSLTAANSGNITIGAGAATQLAITTQPSSTATSGTAFGQQPVIQLQDASGNAVSQSGVVVTAAVNTGSGTLGGTLTATTDASGTATFTNLKITGTTGIRTLTFTATSLTAANSGNITIGAGAATQLAITTQPSSTATSGTAFGQQPVIQLQDASGNAVSQSGVVVTAAVNTGSGTLGGTLTATTDASGVATFTNLKITGTTGIRTLTFTATSLTAANSGNITISAGAATQLAITTQPSSTATSGTAFGQQPVIQLQDASGNAVSQSGVVVTAAVNTGSGTLGGTLTATTDASGTATFTNLKITGTTGIRTLTFTATSLTAANSGNITISAGAAAQLAITTQPSSTATSGTAFGQQPVIQLQDASGNAVSQSGVVVTAAVNTGSGTLGGTLTATTDASGTATFTNLKITGTTGIRTLTFTATSLTAANSGNITIGAGAATQLAITTQPSSTATSGTAFGQQPVIQLQDASGNAVSQSGVVVTAAVNTGSGTLGGTLTATTDASGVATFTNLKITGTTGIRTLTFTATSLTAANSGNITISAGAATQLAITTQPSSTATSGTAFGQQPVIQLQDASGNAVSQSGVVVTAAVNTGSGTLGGTLTATTDASGVATFTNLKITGTTGIRTLTFTATSLTAANSGNITISAGAATQLAITTQPSSTATSGTAFGQQPVIQLQDASGNAVSQSGVVVTAAVNTGSGVLGGTLTATTDASGTATFTNLKITGTTGIRTLTFTATSLTAANSGNITIGAGAATQLAITTQPSSTATSGTAFGQQPVIQLQDASGNAVSQSGVVVTAAVNTGSGVLGGTLTATTDASGTATFTNLKITGTTGIRTLTFTATSLTAANSGNITIGAGAATQLAITTQPSSTATSGTAFGQQPVIQLQDASGNAVSQSGVVVTAAVNTGSGVLGGTLTATTDASGTATFTNLKITGTTGIRTLTFTATSLTAANSGNVTISAGAATQLAITTQPSSTATSGTAFGQQPVIQLQDASGNAVSQSGVVVTAAVNTGSGVLGGTLTATTDASGTATFTNLKITGTTGIRTLTFTATSLTAANSGNVTISAGAATQLAITTQPSSTATSGTAFGQQPVIQLQDASGNAVSQSGVVVTAAVNTGSGTLGGTLTATTDASGVATFTNLKITGTTGIRTLTFTATSLTAANSGNITISAGAAAVVKVETAADGSGSVVSAQNLTSGNSITVYAITRDASGNFVSNVAADSWSLTNKTGGIVNGNLVAAGDSKSATMTGAAVGAANISAVSGALTSTPSGTITVVAGVASQLAIATQPSASAPPTIAFAQQPVIQLKDAAGNNVSQSGVTVTVAVATGAGTLGGTLTAITDASGVATFAGLKISGASGDRTLQFSATGLTGATSNTVTITLNLAVSISSQTNVIAFGASTGAVTVAAVGGTSPYQFKIGNGTLQSGGSFSSLAAGTYVVTVQDVNGVTSTVNVIITQPSAALAVNISSQTNVIAFGGTTGAVTVAATGGTGPYQYKIGNGTLQSSGSFSSLAAGTYVVTVQDANGVTSTVNVIITQPSAALAVNISSQTNVIAFGGTTGAVTVAAVGGTSPYQFKIGNGTLQSGGSFSSLAAGTYVVTVQDVNGVTSTVNVIITQPSAALAVNISSQTNVIAFGGTTGAVTVAATGGTGPYQYKIGNGTLQSSGTFSSLAAGTYVVTVQDVNGVTSTVNVVITQPSAALALNISSQTNVIAFGGATGAVTVAAVGGTSPYQFKIGNGTLQSSGTFSSLAAGTYVVTVQDVNGVTSTVTVVITQPSAALAVNISSQTNVIAFGASTGAVTVAAVGGTSPYQFKIGNGTLQNSPTFTGLAAGTYVVTVSDANAVTSTVNVAITQPSAALAVNVSSQTNVIAFGGTTGAVTVAATGGTAPYQFKIGNGTLQSSGTFSSLAAGTYVVTVQDVNGVTSTVNVIITQPSAALAVNISSQTNVIAFGGTTGAVTVAATGGTGPYQYKIGNGTLQSSGTFSSLAAGTYVVTVQDANGVTSTVNVIITQPSAALAVNISSQTNVIAFGGTTGAVTVAATGGTGPYQYKIGNGTLQSSGSFSSLAAGTYVVTVQDANGVTSTVNVIITQPSAALAVNISSQTNVIAFGGTTGAVTVAATGGTGPYQYKIGNGTLQSSGTFSSLAAGTYVVTVQDVNGVTSTVTVVITQPSAALAVNISSQTNVIAFGASTGAVTVAAVGGTSPYQFKIGNGTLQNSPTFTGLAAGTYVVTVSDANAVTSTVNVAITQPSAALAVNVSSQTNVIAFGGTTGAVTVAATGGTAPYQFKIGNGTLQSSGTFSSLAAGTYVVTVQDVNGVTSTVNVIITQPSAALAVNISSQTNVIAFGGTTGAVTVAATGGTGPYQYKIGNGTLQSSGTFSSLAAGTYVVTVQDVNGVTSTVNVIITQPSAALAVNISSQTNVIAFGGTTGAVTVAATGGTGPYQYKIGNGTLQSSGSFSSLAAGTYVVTVQDANGVTSTVNVIITQPSAALAVNISSQTNVIAFGGTTGAVTVAAVGGTGPYQYKIGNGTLQSSGTFSSLAAGTYVVTVQDVNGVTSTVNVIITQPSAALAVNISSQTNVIAFGGTTGAVTVAAVGGTSPYQFKIGNGTLQNSPTFTGLAAGTYVVTVSDANAVTSTVNVVITQPSAALAVNISAQTNVIAFGGTTGAVTVAATGGTGPYQYKIGNGTLQSSGTFSSLAAGNYVVTVRDANGVTSTVNVTITQPSAALAVSIGSQTNVSVFGASTGSVTVSATGGTGPYQYKIGNGTLQSSGTFSSLAAGTYVVTVQDANGVTSTVNVIITQPSAALAVNISSQTNVIAFGGTTGAVTVAAVGGTGPYQYKIGNGTLQSSGTFSSLAAGTYVVTVQDVNGVTSTVNVVITQPSAALAVNISSQTNVIAFGGTTGAVTVSATGGTGPYQYKIGNGTLQSSGSFSSLAAGTYVVTVQDVNGVTSTVNVVITQPSAALAVNISSQTNVIAFGGTTGAVTVAATGGTGPYQYKIGNGTLQSSGTFSSLAAGNYVVTVRDANGVTSTVNVTINQPAAALAVSIGSQTNVSVFGASTGSVTVSATGGTGPYQYKIGNGTLQSSGTFGSLAAGTYVVTVQDANGVTSTVTVVITQAAANTVITFAVPAKTYGDGDFAAGATSTNTSTAIVYTSDNTSVATIVNGYIHIVGAGTANITASQTGDSNNTPQSVTRQLTVAKAILTATAVDQTRAYGIDNPTLTVAYTGFVNGDNVNKLITIVIASTTANKTTLPGNYTITLSGGSAANYQIYYMPGTLKITPLTNANATNITVNKGTLSPAFSGGVFNYSVSVDNNIDNIALTALFDPTASAIINGVALGNGNASGNLPLSPGYNTITVTITAQDGVTKLTYIITVYRGLAPDNMVQTNILTPNGDGKNDRWVIKDIELYPQNRVSIFDRAGRPVYSKNQYSNDWDGTINGAQLVQGTYYYIIELTPNTPPIKGFITIIRSKQ